MNRMMEALTFDVAENYEILNRQLLWLKFNENLLRVITVCPYLFFKKIFGFPFHKLINKLYELSFKKLLREFGF